MRQVIILCHPRSGASYLQGLLDSHPAVSIPDEIALFDLKYRSKLDIRYALADPSAYWRTKMADRFRPGVELVGGRLHYYDGCGLELTSLPAADLAIRAYSPEAAALQDSLFSTYLPTHAAAAAATSRFYDFWRDIQHDKSIKIIHFRRRNLIRVFLSLVEAAVTKRAIATFPGRVYNTPPTEVSPVHLVHVLRELKVAEEQIPRQFRQHHCLDVVYEDLVADPNAVLKTVLEFLELPQAELTSRFHPIATAPPREWISNFNVFVGEALEEKQTYVNMLDYLDVEGIRLSNRVYRSLVQ